MNEVEIRTVLSHLSNELYRVIDTIGEIPYVAMPPEKPEIICFSGKGKELTIHDINKILMGRQYWVKIIYPDDRKRVFAALARCKNEGIPFNIGYRVVRKDYSVRHVNDKGDLFLTIEVKITQIEGIVIPLGVSAKPESGPLLEIKEVATCNNVNSNCFQGNSNN